MRKIAQDFIAIATVVIPTASTVGCHGSASRTSTSPAAAPTHPATAPATHAQNPICPDDQLLELTIRRLSAELPEHAGRLVFVGISFNDRLGHQQDPPAAVLNRLADLPLRLRPRSTAVQPRTEQQAAEGSYHDPTTGEAGLDYFIDVTRLSDNEWLLNLGWTPGPLGGRAEQYRATRQPTGTWTLRATGRVSAF